MVSRSSHAVFAGVWLSLVGLGIGGMYLERRLQIGSGATIGTVARQTGGVQIRLQSVPIWTYAVDDQRVYQNTVIATGGNGQAVVRLEDGRELSLAADTTVVIGAEPGESRQDFVVTLVTGTVAAAPAAAPADAAKLPANVSNDPKSGDAGALDRVRAPPKAAARLVLKVKDRAVAIESVGTALSITRPKDRSAEATLNVVSGRATITGGSAPPRQVLAAAPAARQAAAAPPPSSQLSLTGKRPVPKPRLELPAMVANVIKDAPALRAAVDQQPRLAVVRPVPVANTPKTTPPSRPPLTLAQLAMVEPAPLSRAWLLGGSGSSGLVVQLQVRGSGESTDATASGQEIVLGVTPSGGSLEVLQVPRGPRPRVVIGRELLEKAVPDAAGLRLAKLLLKVGLRTATGTEWQDQPREVLVGRLSAQPALPVLLQLGALKPEETAGDLLFEGADAGSAAVALHVASAAALPQLVSLLRRASGFRVVAAPMPRAADAVAVKGGKVVAAMVSGDLAYKDLRRLFDADLVYSGPLNALSTPTALANGPGRQISVLRAGRMFKIDRGLLGASTAARDLVSQSAESAFQVPVTVRARR